MSNGKGELERFDICRGDRFTRMRETSVQLVAFGFEMYAVIAWAFERYMAGNPGDPIPEIEIPPYLPDDLKFSKRDIATARGVLLGMIEHQKVNAARAYDKKEAARRSAGIRWGRERADNANASTDNANASTDNANATSIDKDKISSSGKLESLSISENVGPSGVANVAPPGGGTFARTATDAKGRTYREDKFADPDEVRRFVAEREAEAYDPEDLATDDHKRLLGVFRGTITKRARQLSASPGAFAAVCFDVVAEYCELTHKAETTKGIDAFNEVWGTYGENITTTIMGRLKARAVALGVDAK